MEESTPLVKDTDAELDAIIDQLDDCGTALPEAAIEAARQHRDAIIPKLIASIERATRLARAGESVSGEAHFFALFLLAEFRAKEALPAIVEAVSLPGKAPDDLFGDAITSTLHRAFGVLASDQIRQTILPLIRDRRINEWVRSAAAHSLVMMVRTGLLERLAAVALLRELLREGTEQRDQEIVTTLVFALSDLQAKEARDEIKTAYDVGLVNNGMIDLETMNEDFGLSHEEFAERHWYLPATVEDTVEELRRWSSFSPHEDLSSAEFLTEPVRPLIPTAPVSSLPGASRPRVGRNEPCPCGSGKKFKKCCGAPGRK